MEVRSVVKSEPSYPEMKDMSKSKLKNNIPKSWKKVGMTSLVISLLLNNKSFASNVLPPDIIVDLSGTAVYRLPVYEITDFVCAIVSIISIITFFISGIVILYTKLKAKRKGEKVKVNKKLKVICIIFIVLLILSKIIPLIVDLIE